MSKPTVLQVTSNGTGMGHLSRQLTIALSGQDKFDSVIMSLSGALARVQAASDAGDLGEQLRFEYCANHRSGRRRSVRSYMFNLRWKAYLRDRVQALATEVGASTVVFDGVVPYDGLVAARRALPNTPFVWVRRGMWQSTAPTKWLKAAREFDLVIEPGDLAPDRGPTSALGDATTVAPICLDSVLPRQSRQAARATLGLDPDRPALLLAPGAGAVGSVEESARAVIETVRKLAPDWTIVVTKQAIAQHSVAQDRDDIVVLENVFPLVPHLAAFDAAVGAAGYNSVHELLNARIPTVFVPSKHHKIDDQVARADGVVAKGWAIGSEPSLADAIAELLDPASRAELAIRLQQITPMTGGEEAADLIAELTTGATPANLWPAPHVGRQLIDVRTQLTEQPQLSDRVSTADLRESRPIEHLVDGASANYRERRIAIARQLYRW